MESIRGVFFSWLICDIFLEIFLGPRAIFPNLIPRWCQEYPLHLESSNVPTLITENVPRLPVNGVQPCRRWVLSVELRLHFKLLTIGGINDQTVNLKEFPDTIYNSALVDLSGTWIFQRFNLPKSFRYLKWRCWTLFSAIFGWVFPHMSRIHTAYTAEIFQFRYLNCFLNRLVINSLTPERLPKVHGHPFL